MAILEPLRPLSETHESFGEMFRRNAEKPEKDQTLVMLQQLFRLSEESFKQAELHEHQARMTKLKCMANLEELRVRIEMREEQLGIERGRCIECNETCVVRPNGNSDCCNAVAEDL